MDVMIVLPEFEELKKEVEKLRTELSMLVLERDELRFVICRNIEMEYMLRLGGLEYKAFETQCTYLRLKRKAELLQAKRNRQEAPDLKAVEAQLDAEFAEFQTQLSAQIGKMNEALRLSECDCLSDEDNKELKSLYRKVVRALHPDLNPDVTPKQIELFYHAVDAYKAGDLRLLRAIEAMVAEPVLPDTHEDAMMALIKEHDRLKGYLDEINGSIAAIKEQYPYTLKEYLDDEEKAENRKNELERLIRQYQELISKYEERIKNLLEGTKWAS